MKLRFAYIVLLFLSLSSFSLYAQDDDGDDAEDDNDDVSGTHNKSDGEKHYYVFSARANVTVPHPIGNSAFRKSFVGVYEAEVGFNVMLYKGLFIGGTVKNGELKITGNKIAGYNAIMEVDNAAGKIGGDLYIGDRNRVIFSAAISVGNNWTHYYNMVRKDPKDNNNRISIPLENSRFTTFFYEPEVNLFFLVDDNFGVGATLTYSVYTHTFDPYELSLNQWAAFDANPSGNTSYLSFGFGFYYNFLHKKK